MKFIETASALLAVSGSVAAFTTAPARTTTTSSSLNLFGKGGDGEKKGPGMMDQLAMFKKAQEVAQKKGKIDEELKKMEFFGESANGNVKVTLKYVPVANPMDPNPEYEPVNFAFDDEFFESSSPEDLSEALKECMQNGIEKTNEAVAEKYAALQVDLMEAFGKQKAEATEAE